MPQHPLWIGCLMFLLIMLDALALFFFDKKASFFGYFFGRALLIFLYALQVSCMLRFKGEQQRFSKTFSALMGKEVLFTFFIFIALLASDFFNMRPNSLGGAFFSLLFLLLYSWDVFIEGFIFQRALNVRLLLGLSLAISLLIMNQWIELKVIMPLYIN